MRRWRSLTERLSSSQRTMTPGAGGGRTPLVAPQPRPLPKPETLVAGGNGLPSDWEVVDPNEITVSMQVLIVDRADGAYFYVNPTGDACLVTASDSAEVNKVNFGAEADGTGRAFLQLINDSQNVFVAEGFASEYHMFINNMSGAKMIEASDIGAGSTLGFFAATPVAQPTVTGSRGGNAALASLLVALANLGLIVNGTTG